ncbi:hypothetical protein B566_EDAN016469 [Ephemera danica]|nr:hypothetical protein B566_EDAN016469 [Ephemera danica]
MADIDFDAVLAKIGERGRYQNRLFYLLSIPATLPAVFLYFNQVFASATPEHWCRVPSLDATLGVEAARSLAIPRVSDTEFSRCQVYDVNFTQLLLSNVTWTPDPSWNRTSCTHGWHYNRTYYDETLVSQLDLVCEKSWWPATSTTMFGIGSLIGNILLGLERDRWLLSKGRIDEAEVIVQRMAKAEHRKLNPDEMKIAEESVDFRDLLRSRILRRCFLLICVIWVTNAVVYSGLTFNSGNLGVREQTAFLIGAAVETFGYLASWWAMDRYGRRAVVWSTMLIGAYVWISVLLAMIGRFSVAGSFSVFYVYMGELLPTVVRVQSMAFGTFVSNLGRVIFPYIVYLTIYWRVLPLLVFGLLSIIGAVATILLPETLGRPLPQTLHDGEALHLQPGRTLVRAMADIDFDAALAKVFASATPEHWCRVPSLDATLGVEAARSLAIPRVSDTEFSRCQVYDVNFTQLLLSNVTWTPDPSWNRTSCTHGWHYNRTYYDETLVSQLDLVCDKSWWPASSTTFFGIGSLVGNILLGLERDRLGRRPVLLIIVAWHVTFSVCTALFTTNYVIYTVLRAFNALVNPAIYQVPFVIVQAIITFWLRDWQSLLLCTSLPFVLLFGYWWLLPESPRWLLSKGRIDEAEEIVQRMAKVNDFTQSCFQAEHDETKEDEIQADESDVDFRDVLRSSVLRKCFLLICIIWVSNAVVYIGLAFNSGNLGVREQTAFLIGAAVEIPGILVGWWAMDRYGRRAVVWCSMLFGGVACVSCAFVPDTHIWISVTLAMIGRFSVAGSYAVFYVYMGELLPTVVRVQSLAFGSFVSNLGRIIFPSIVYLANYWRVLPLLVFGVLSIIGAVATMLLPETLGRPLPQTLRDGEALHLKPRSKTSRRKVYIKTENGFSET